MSKKHAHDEAVMEQAEHEAEEQAAENATEAEAAETDFSEGATDESGIPTLTVGKLTIKAPDKYLEGHVMTADEAGHYSNFIRSRCASNMISMEKRNNKVWTAENAAEYYDAYKLGAPRGKGPSEETILDEALDMLLEELAARTGNPLPSGKGSKAKIAELKEGVQKRPKYQARIAELIVEVKADYAAKAAAKAEAATEEKPPVLTVDSLFADDDVDEAA